MKTSKNKRKIINKISIVDKQNMKYHITVKLIQQVQKLYKKSSKYEKEYLETIIGAAIFYLPSGNKLWSKKISKEALKSYLPKVKNKTKVIKEHEYPRKVASRELLKINWDSFKQPENKLKDLYLKKYGRYNYVTQKENGALRRYQKVDIFKNPSHSYKKAGIQLIKIIDSNYYEKAKKHNKSVIDKLLK